MVTYTNVCHVVIVNMLQFIEKQQRTG